MKRILLILMFACSTLMMQAKSDVQSELVQKLLEINSLTSEKIKPILIEAFKNQGISNEISEILADKVVTGEAFEKYKMKVVQLYIDRFTESELQELLQFYETKLGKRMLEELPKIAVGLSSLSIEYEKELTEELTNFFEALKIIE